MTAYAASGSVSATSSLVRLRRFARTRTGMTVQRLAIVVVALALWQWLTNIKVVDPFFWGSPAGVAKRLWGWVTQGTAQGSLVDRWVTPGARDDRAEAESAATVLDRVVRPRPAPPRPLTAGASLMLPDRFLQVAEMLGGN